MLLLYCALAQMSVFSPVIGEKVFQSWRIDMTCVRSKRNARYGIDRGAPLRGTTTVEQLAYCSSSARGLDLWLAMLDAGERSCEKQYRGC